MNTFTWNCSKNKLSVHQLLSFNSSVEQSKKKRKDCISSLVRQQSVNQGLSFPPLFSESCRSCRFTLMSIFSSTFSPTLSRHSAWRISSLSDPSISTHFRFRPPSLLLCFLSFMAFSCAADVGFGWGLVGRGLWGWAFRANWNIHVCVPVSLCESDFTCVRALHSPPPLFYQVMHKALSFDSAPKIRLDTSITHEPLCTRSHDPLRRRN